MHEHQNTVVYPLKILKYIRLHGKCKSEELSKVLNLEERTVRRYCKSLKAAGYPIRSKGGRYGGYYLEEPEIHPAEWEMLRQLLPVELYKKIELRLLEEFKPQD